MTTCFPTDTFNQQLIRWDRHIQLCWFDFSLCFLVSHIYQSAVRRRGEGTKALFMLQGCLFAVSCFVTSARKGQSLLHLWMLPFPNLPFFVSPFLKGRGSPRNRLTGAFNNWLTFMLVPALIKENTGREEKKHWWSIFRFSLPPALN